MRSGMSWTPPGRLGPCGWCVTGGGRCSCSRTPAASRWRGSWGGPGRSRRSCALPSALGPLSALVMRLLAKTAEERYQTAAGAAADLRRCQAEWEAHGRIAPFPLGAQDVPDRLLIPETLYGREREIDSLLASFDRVAADGTPELVLVSGYSGIGKSSVVNELHKVLVP